MRMSVCARRRRRRVRPRGDFRERAREVLRRVRASGVRGGGVGVCAVGCGRSMRITLAPWSDRRRPVKGPVKGVGVSMLFSGWGLSGIEENGQGGVPGARPANSRTLRPVNGGGEVMFPRRGCDRTKYQNKRNFGR